MENGNNNFELKVILRVLKKFWIIILAATLLFGVLGYGYSALTGRTVYVGKASFWVNIDDKNNTQILGAAQMATNYSELAATDKLRRSAVEYGSLDDEWNMGFDEAVKKLKTMISVSKTDENSQIFSVYVRSSDPNETFVAITAVQNVMADVVAGVNDTSANTAAGESYITRLDDVQSMEDITVSTSSNMLKAVIGAGVGFILSFALSFFSVVSNRKIDGAESVASNVSYSLVGNISSGEKKKRKGLGPTRELSVVEKEGFNIMRSKVVASGQSHSVLGVFPVAKEQDSFFVSYNLAKASLADGIKASLVCSEEWAQELCAADLALPVVTYAANEDGFCYANAICDAVNAAGEKSDAVILSLPATDSIVDIVKISKLAGDAIICVSDGSKVKNLNGTVSALENVDTCIRGVCYVDNI